MGAFHSIKKKWCEFPEISRKEDNLLSEIPIPFDFPLGISLFSVESFAFPKFNNFPIFLNLLCRSCFRKFPSFCVEWKASTIFSFDLNEVTSYEICFITREIRFGIAYITVQRK